MTDVELVYVPSDGKAVVVKMPWEPALSVADVLRLSGLAATFPEITTRPLGIFAKMVTAETLVAPGDRVEIYRPLLCDPQTSRRARAKRR